MAENAASGATSSAAATVKSSNIQVTVKVRPLIKREKEAKLTKLWRVKENTIQLVEPASNNNDGFTFDHIFDEETSTADMFNKIAKPIVDATLKGFNGTIFAYGQTSSGKTHTMLGDDLNPGIMILAVREIFNEIETLRDRQFLLRVGYIEIYNEKLYDLLDPSIEPKISEKTRGEVSVSNKEFMVSNENTIMELLLRGNKERKTAGTKMNERSSRSHTIFRLIIESTLSDQQTDDDERVVQTSYLNLVDLAGSERAVQTGATGSRLIEAGNINKSLLSLSRVINQLAEQSDPESFVNYRNSKLTRILAASLGGNAMTSIICNVTPAALEETASTLNFAMSAKKVQNKPQLNEICSETVFMKRLMREITRLNKELASAKLQTSEQVMLQECLQERQSHILRAKSTQNPLRRRTWAPSLTSSADPALQALGTHVSRILPPGHRTQHLLAPPPSTTYLANSTPAFANASDTSLFDANSSTPFDLLLTPPKFDAPRCMISSTRGSAMQPPKLPRPAHLPALPPPSSITPSITLQSSSGDQATVLATSSPSTIVRLLSTPNELQRKQRRMKAPVEISPSTPGHLIVKLEKDLTDLQNFTRLESGMAAVAADDGDGGSGGGDSLDGVELAALRGRLQDMESELEMRRGEHEELIMYRTGLMSNASMSEEERSAASEKLTAANADIERLTADLSDSRQRLSAAETACQASLDARTALELDHAAQLDELRAGHAASVLAARQQADAASRAQLTAAAAAEAAAIKSAEHALSLQTSVEYEYEQFRANARRRELELVGQLDDQRQGPTLLQQSVAKLTEALRTAEASAWSLEQRCAAMAERSTELEGQLAAMQLELEATRTEVAEQRLGGERSAEQIAELEQQVAGLQRLNEQTIGEAKRQLDEHRLVEVTWIALQAELTQKVTSLTDSNAALDAEQQAAGELLQSQLAQLRAQLDAAQLDVAQVEQHRIAEEQLQRQVADLTGQLASIGASVEERLDTLRSQLSEARAMGEQAQQERDADVATLRSRVAELTDQLAGSGVAVDERVQTLQAELAEAVVSVERAAEEQRDATQKWLMERSELEEKCNGLAERLAGSDERAGVIQTEMDAMREDVEQNHQTCHSDRTALQQTNSHLTERLTTTTNALETLRSDHRQVQTDYEELSQQLMDGVQENAQLTTQLDAANEDLCKQKQQATALTAQLINRASSKAHSDLAASALAVALNHQVARTTTLIGAIADHCLPPATVPSMATAEQLQSAILAEFDQQLDQIHELHQQLDDQAGHFEQLELQMDERVYELRLLLSDTDQRLGEISAQYANSTKADATSGAASMRELHALHEQLRAAEKLSAHTDQLLHEVQSERDENQKAFEQTIAQKLDLEERCAAQREELRELAELSGGRGHELEAALRRLQAAEADLSAVREEHAADRQRVKELSADQATVTAEVERLRGRELQLADELVASQTAVQLAAAGLADTSAELRKAQNDSENLAAQLAEAGRAGEQLRLQLEQLVAEKGALEAVVENDRRVIEQAEQECQSMRDTMHDAMLAMANGERMAEERDASRAESFKLTEELRTSEKRQREQDEQLAAAVEAKQAAMKASTELGGDLDRVRQSLHERTQECAQLRLQLDELQAQANERAAAASQTTGTIVADLQRQLADLQQRSSAMHSTIERLQSELAAATQAVSRSHADHKAAVDQLHASTARHVEQLRLATEAHRETVAELSELRSRHRSEQSFNEKELKISELETHLQHLHHEDQARRQQNDALHSRNQQMTDELNDLRARLDRDRKTRRRSAHDDSRTTFTSGQQPDAVAARATPPPAAATSVRSMETQTGDATETCGCAEMDRRIQVLVRDLKIKDCHVARLKMEKECSSAERDNAELKKLVAKHEHDLLKLTKRLAEQAEALKAKSTAHSCTKQCSATVSTQSAQPPSQVHREQQTDEFAVINGSALIAQQEQDKAAEELTHLSNKYRQAKWLCQRRKEDIERLELQLKEVTAAAAVAAASRSSTNGEGVATKLGDRMEKENTPAKDTNRLPGAASAAEQKLAADVRRLESENLALRGDVHTLQKLAAVGNGQQASTSNLDEENRLKLIIDELDEENRVTRRKYDGLKLVLVARNRQVQFLENERVALMKAAEK